MKYPGGWLDLEASMPKPISDAITIVQVDDGAAVTDGTIIRSSVYHVPTGGAWVASPIAINSEPLVIALNSGTWINEELKAMSMSAQTQMANLGAPPPPMENLVYCYGNHENEPKYQMHIELDLGAGNFTLFELSILENAATEGGRHGKVEVFEFDKGANWTGVNTLQIIFNEFFGPINLGLRLESTVPDSSIFGLQAIVLPTNKY